MTAAASAVSPADSPTLPTTGHVELFHVSPATLTVGTRLVPGTESGRGSTPAGPFLQVCLALTVPQARQWARYIGERTDADRVGVYRVRVDAATLRPARGCLPNLPEVRADTADVLEVLEWVDPWTGRSDAYRQQLRVLPF